MKHLSEYSVIFFCLILTIRAVELGDILGYLVGDTDTVPEDNLIDDVSEKGKVKRNYFYRSLNDSYMRCIKNVWYNIIKNCL